MLSLQNLCYIIAKIIFLEGIHLNLCVKWNKIIQLQDLLCLISVGCWEMSEHAILTVPFLIHQKKFDNISWNFVCLIGNSLTVMQVQS